MQQPHVVENQEVIQKCKDSFGTHNIHEFPELLSPFTTGKRVFAVKEKRKESGKTFPLNVLKSIRHG